MHNFESDNQSIVKAICFLYITKKIFIMSLFDEIEIEEVTDDDSSDDEHEEIVDNKDDDDELEIIVDVEDENSSDDEREEIIDDDSADEDDELNVVRTSDYEDDEDDDLKVVRTSDDEDGEEDEEDEEDKRSSLNNVIYQDDDEDEEDDSDLEDVIPDYDSIDTGEEEWKSDERREIKPSEYTFEDIINPNFNEIVHEYNPEKFKLDDDGRIGFNVYRYKTFQEANNNSIPAGRKPTFTIWDVNVAFALAKVYYLCIEPTNTFGTCDKQVKELIKVLFKYQEDYKKIVDKYEEIIDELMSSDEFFLKHPYRISTGDIKVVGNDKETASTVLEFFEHLDDVCPLKDLVDAKDLDPDSKFDDIDDVVINS